MKPENVAYLRYRIERAGEALEDARVNLEGARLHTAVNRLYYACFYSVSALLLTQGLSSRKHTGVRSLFDLHWIKTGRLPVEMSRHYRILLEHREEADYGERMDFQPDEVREWFRQSCEFVDTLGKHVEEQPALHHDD